MEGKPKTILIVEDESLQTEALSAAFQKENFRVGTAQNGGEGIAQARAVKPDLIILDLVMPIVDGVEMLKQLNSDPELQHIPVLILTNFALQDEIKPFAQTGKDQFFIKTNLTLADVITKVKAILP